MARRTVADIETAFSISTRYRVDIEIRKKQRFRLTKRGLSKEFENFAVLDPEYQEFPKLGVYRYFGWNVHFTLKNTRFKKKGEPQYTLQHECFEYCASRPDPDEPQYTLQHECFERIDPFLTGMANVVRISISGRNRVDIDPISTRCRNRPNNVDIGSTVRIAHLWLTAFVDLLIYDSWAFDSGRSQLFPHQVPRQLKHSLDDNLDACYRLSIDEERAGLVMISV